MPRLFIAIAFSEPVQDRLAEIARDLPGADWVYSEQYHLTLRFLGETELDTLRALREGLGAVSAQAFFLSLRGVGIFPLRGDPEILWAGVARQDGLTRLKHKIESVLGRYGVPPEARKFFPHVSLAKIKSCREESVGRYLAQHSLFSTAQIPVRSFGLFSSRLTPEGAIHTLEAEYPLDGILDEIPLVEP